MKKHKKSILTSAFIWLAYIFTLWARVGVKRSISSLFSFIPGNYLTRRLIVGIVYVAAAFFMAYSVYNVDVAMWVNWIGIIGALGFAVAGIIPDSMDRHEKFDNTKDITHIAGTLTAIYGSMIYIVVASIVLHQYWYIAIPVVVGLSTLLMLKKNTKNHTTWIELVVFAGVILFLMII